MSKGRINKRIIVEYLEKYWPKNKAKGLLAQSLFRKEIKDGIYSKFRKKFLDGCWVLSPKRSDFFKFRFCFFVHPVLMQNAPDEDKLEPESIMGPINGMNFKRVAGFLRRAGFDTMYAVPVGDNLIPPERINWLLYRYDENEEVLRSIDIAEFFSRWTGRGRQSKGSTWGNDLKGAYLSMEEDELVFLLLNEAFYSTFLKGKLKKPVSDPYDIDGFLISHSTGAVIPLEIKEKYPAVSGERFFGIDAGRVLMLLRICLPNDANAFYIVREVEKDVRRFVDWKFMPLSEIILSASWNLQRGGKGMGGQETQTIRLPYDNFKKLEADVLSDKNLAKISNLPKEVKRLATEFKIALEEEYGLNFD